MASNRNTQISPASNQLDPLASYYQYKFRYQQIAGAVNGENVDPHLQAYSLREDDASDVLWNLGGRLVGDRVEFPAATEASFDSFVRSTTQSFPGLFSQFLAQGDALPYEDFVFIDGAGENSAVTTSLPNKFASALLFSSQKIVDELVEGLDNFGQAFPLGQIDPQTYELNELQEHLRNIPTNSFAVRRFIDRLYRHISDENRTNLYDRFSSDIDGSGPQRRVIDGTQQEFGITGRVTENFLDVLQYYIKGGGIIEFSFRTQQQYSGDDEALVRQLYHFRMVQALLPEIPKNLVKQVLTTVTMPKNTCIRYQSDSAFVRTQHTYKSWDSDAFNGMAGDYVRPRYSFYVPGYEKLISGSVGEGIPEAALPNSYIRNLYFRQPNAEYLPQITAQATLDSKVVSRSTQGVGFYSDYTRLVPTANQNQVNVSAELGSLLLVPSNAGSFLEERRAIPAPMSIEVAFRRSTWDSTAQDMNDRGTSLPILRFLGECYGSPFQPPADIPSKESQPLVYSSQYIVSFGIQTMSPIVQNFEVFDARSVFRQPVTGRPLSRKFIVLSENPAGAEVHQRFENGAPLQQTFGDREKSLATAQIMEAKAARNADRAYTRILNGEAMPSVALAYGLTKKTKDDNVILQTVMIGNGAGSLNTSYFDTQIKYNTEYVYELDEFSLVYSPEYSVGITCPNYPIWLMEQYLNIGRDGYLGVWTGDTLTQQERTPELLFEMFVKEYPAPKIVRLPVHDRRESEDLSVGGFNSGFAGTFYPSVKVMDRPPSPPSLEMFPLRGVDSQIKVHVNTNAGSFIGDNALDAVVIGGRESEFAELYRYQKKYLNFELPEGSLEFQPEGRQEIRNISLYRTTAIDINVDKYNDIYKSFNEADPTVTVRRYSTDPSEILEENIGIQEVLSYDITDNILPNVNYYYTCTIEDHHGHVSNPGAIFRVRLVSDKGLMIPEIDSVVPKRRRPQTPTKDLTRYLQIDASNIQSFPYFEMGSDGNIIAAPNIASHLGKSLEDKAFIVRLTSKDTGRIFDIKIGFEIKYDGEEDEQDGEPSQQGGGRPVADPPPVEEPAQDEEENEGPPPAEDHNDWDDMQQQHEEQGEEQAEEDDEAEDNRDYGPVDWEDL